MTRLIGSPSSSLPNAANYVNQTYGEFVASDPEDVPLIVRPLHAAARNQCERWSANPSGFRVPLGPGTMSDMCTPYLDGLNYSSPILSSPFSGGQCSGDTYLYQLDFNFVGGGSDSSTRSNTGPVGIRINPETNLLETRNGVSTPANPSTDWVVVSTTPVESFEVNNMQNITSGADNCGNPPGDYVPGPNPAPDPGPDFTINLGDFVVDISVGDVTVDIDGKISIPIRIDNQLELDLFGDKGGGGDCAPTGIDEGPTGDTNVDGEQEAEEGRRIRAVRVTIIDPWRGGTIIGLQGGEELVIPRHANLTFEDDAGYESDPVSVRVSGQRVECPFIEGAVKVRVSPAPGVRLFFQLLYIKE